MKILSIGTFNGLSNTCLHRHWALKKIALVVDEVNTSQSKKTLWNRILYHLFLRLRLPIPLPERNNENHKICKLVDMNTYDVVWIDKGITIKPDTLLYIKKKSPITKIVSYSPDNMALRHNQSLQYLKCVPLYDVHITTKSYILDDLHDLGAKGLYFLPKCYEPTFHYPRNINKSDINRLGSDVGFIGAWEKERCNSILHLVNNGIKVRVWGNKKWLKYRGYNDNLIIENQGLFSDDYPKAFKAFKISLCFLRKMNYDQQTSRTMEIPACGGFMMAERTDEHMTLFTEGKEAEFFSSNEELLEKCRYYLDHEEERLAIAINGTLRCKTSDYSNEGMVKRVLQICTNDM